MTLAELREQLSKRATDAQAMAATAPVSAVLAVVLEELETVNSVPAATPGPDKLIPLEEAAQRLDVTVRWLRETRPAYVVELSPKMLKVSERRLADWLRRA